jgi:hypothetical protein
MYSPNFSATLPTGEVLNYDMTNFSGRNDCLDKHYIHASAGAGSHLTVQRVENSEKDAEKLGHHRKIGIVSMTQQCPRDNAMYNRGESTNLKAMDKALKHKTSKFGLFSHTIIDSSEIMKNCK